MMGGEDAAGRDPGSAGKGLWAGGGGHLGGRGSFPEGKSQEILQELLQWACYRHSSLLGLPEPPRLACLISPDIVMIRCYEPYTLLLLAK